MKDVAKWAESGFEIKRVYGPDDVHGDPAEKLGEPGAYPFTRHVYPTGYRAQSWRPSLYSGFGEAEDANKRFRFLLEQGNGQANIAFDLPSQLGFDSDDPSVANEVGRVGVAVDSLVDFETLFEGVPLDQVPVSMNISGMAPVMLAMLVVSARRQGVDLADVRGTIANDIGHEFVARGAWAYPAEPSFRLLGDTAEFVVRNMPRFYPFNIRAILLHEKGAAPPQEVGYAVAIARSYVEVLLDRGLAIDDFAPRISFFFGVGLHMFEEAAKFRAARRLWARTLHDDYGAREARSQGMRFTCIAACGSYFASELPELNLVRGTLGALGAALGGAQSMLGTAIDEAYDIPSEHTQLLALRSQQILALESDVTHTVDPLGGSYFVEALTDRIEEMACELIASVNTDGGVLAAIESGSIQRDIEERAFQLKQQLDRGERPWVGVNVYRPDNAGERDVTLWEPDPGVLDRRRGALKRLRAERSSDQVKRSLRELGRACREGGDVMPPMIACVEAYATIGEIADVMRGEFGAFVEPVSM